LATLSYEFDLIAYPQEFAILLLSVREFFTTDYKRAGTAKQTPDTARLQPIILPG
jgi:hypothetical protein